MAFAGQTPTIVVLREGACGPDDFRNAGHSLTARIL
jgi:hypothetical protein